MRVGKEDKIDRGEVGKGKGRLGQTFWADGEKRQTNSDAGEKGGIGENSYSEEIQQNRRVTNPRRRKIIIAPTFGCRVREGGCDGSPALNDPFLPEMPEPAATPDFPASAFPFRFHHEQ